MTIADTPDPDEWEPVQRGKGTCFHQALTRWAVLHNAGAHGWRVAVGIVDSSHTGTRNVHAWLECGDVALSAVDGRERPRALFYLRIGIEPDSVRLVNPRKILRAGPINRDAITRLLMAWGGRYRIEAHGGVLAD